MKCDRHLKMKQLFLQRKNITNKELCEKFNISIETARRDLTILEQEGVIKRVYGGAVLSNDNIMPDSMQPWNTRVVTNQEEKCAIAREILQWIPDNSIIAIDSGTSTLEIAKLLHAKKNLTVLTNSMYVAFEISTNTDHLVYSIGGAIKKGEMITTGFLANDFLEYFSHIDLAILSTDGFNVNEGLTDYSVEMGTLKRSMIEKADQVFVAVDHSKFATTAFYKVCGIDKVKLVVTSTKAPQASIDILKNGGVQVVQAAV